MPAYRFRAADHAGTVRSGRLEALSRYAALESLTQQGLIPIEIEEGATPRSAVPRRLARARRAGSGSRRELLTLTQSLASLLRAGLTVERALQISVSLAPGGRLEADLLSAVRSGAALSHAFARARASMPPYYVSMIEAGEAGGSLPETMTRLAVLMQRQEELRERVRSALVYPALLATMVLVTLIVLLTFVLPRFEAMFLESEAPLPWSTRAVLALGRVVADFWWLMAAGVTAATAAFLAWYRSPEGRLRFDRWFARSRLSFGIPAAIDTARLLRTLGTLTANGQPLPAALRIARGTLVNRALTAALEQIILEVNAGAAFSGALARHALFPPIAVQLTRVGEETGRLHEMFLSAADALEERSHIQLGRLLTLFVPLLTILMGLVVAGLIGSVLVGLLSVNEIAF